MKNVTITLDEEVARWARIWAAEHDTSVSRMLGEVLKEKMLEESAYRTSMERYFAVEPAPFGIGMSDIREKTFMTAKYFVDTTILVWARDSFDPKRHAIARAVMETLWKEGSGRISHQVLNEYYVVVTRKLNPGLSPDEARADIRDLLSWNPVAPDREMFEGAWTIQDRYGLSWWDSLIVSAARKTMSDFC